MSFDSTLDYPHKEFFSPPRTRSKYNPHLPAPQPVQPARKAVRVPAPAPQMRVPARVDPPRAGL